MKIKWKGINDLGDLCRGTIYTQSEVELQKFLLKKNIALIEYRQVKVMKSSFVEENIYLFSSLSVLLDSGLSLTDSLSIIMTKPSLKRVKDVLWSIIQDLNKGHALWSVIDKFDNVFPGFICHIIKIGENTGKLAEVCNQISNYLAMKSSFSKKIRSALLTPMITFCVSILLVFGVFIFIVPRFKQVLGSLDKPLPAVTKVMFAISDFLLSPYIAYLLLCLMGATFFIKKFIRKLPILSFIYHRINLIRFLKALLVLNECGVSILESLNYASDVIEDSVFRAKASSLGTLVSRGSSLEGSMNSIGEDFFPKEVIAIVAVGENTGRLTDMLGRVINLQERDLDVRFNFLVNFINPVVVVLLGFFILLVMISIYLPIFNLATNL